jgi:hypothetical protein
MTPTELAYIFSSKVKKQQLYATLLDLANRSILLMHDKHGSVTVEIGPKIDDNLQSFETLLYSQIKGRDVAVAVGKVLEGITSYDLSEKSKISGSRTHVFWWLLRETLRVRGIIQRNLSKRYALMLFTYGVLGSLMVSVLTVGTVRFFQMIQGGEVDFGRLTESLCASATFWLIMVIPMVFVSFILLKFKGRMLGRDWIMTPKYRRYLGQIDAFREFVRLTHKGKLHFESKELRKESIAVTRPYAIACGYIKK